MKVLVVGAQLGNKGAQSMLYITVDELRKRFPECEIYFATIEDYDERSYVFHKLWCSPLTKKIAFGGIKGAYNIIYTALLDVYKALRKRTVSFGHYFDVKKHIEEIDLIIDISGYSIGEKWNKAIHISYIDTIRLAKKYNIPMYLMPQSFGPFEYKENDKEIEDLLEENLKYPRIIFAREMAGLKALEKYNLDNVILSADLVLQNKGVNSLNIFKNYSEPEYIEKVKKNSVGIVPNRQCFRHGSEERNLQTYVYIIDKLLENGFNVVVFRHSREDLQICELIKNNYINNEHVELVSHEFSCLEYDEYVKQFEFLVCSRYHGLVHAYRNGIPCIALGWAIKYQELLQNVNQEQYAFDITSDKITDEAIIKAVDHMIHNLEEERCKVKNAVKTIQEKNCFDIMEEDYRNMKNFSTKGNDN